MEDFDSIFGDCNPEALERFLSDLATVDLKRLPSLDVNDAVRRLPSLEAFGDAVLKTEDPPVSKLPPSVAQARLARLCEHAESQSSRAVASPAVPTSPRSFKSASSSDSDPNIRVPLLSKRDRSDTDGTSSTFDNNLTVAAAAAKSMPPPVTEPPAPSQPKPEPKSPSLGGGRPTRRVAAATASNGFSQVAESLGLSTPEIDLEPSGGPRPNKRKKPDIDWQSIEDPEERKRQRRLAKNRRTAAVSRERKRLQMSTLLQQVTDLETQKEELEEALKERDAEVNTLRKQLDALRTALMASGAAALSPLLAARRAVAGMGTGTTMKVEPESPSNPGGSDLIAGPSGTLSGDCTMEHLL